MVLFFNFQHFLINGLNNRQGFTGRLAANRKITGNIAGGIPIWRDIGKNPVIMTVFSQVFYVGKDFFTL